MMSKLAMLLPSLAHGGAQKVFVEIAGFLASNGHKVVLVSLDREGDLLKRLPPGLELVFLDQGLAHFGVLRRLIQWFRLRKFISENSIVNLLSTITGMNIYTLSCFYFAKNINITIREATTRDNNKSLFFNMLVKLFYKRANRVICTSVYIQDDLIRYAGLDRDRVVALPNPIDIANVKACARIKENKAAIGADEKYCLSAVGRLIKAKGFDVLIDAMAIAKISENIKLVIVGEGPERPILEEKIKALKLENKVYLVGYQSNPYPYIANSDLFVLSSRWEGYVNTVVEAMVLGINIVATDCHSGPGKMLQDKLGYSLVPIESPEKLAVAILEELRNPKDTSGFAELVRLHELPFATKQYLGEYLAI